MRQRRAQLRDALESLGAQAKHVDALLVGDVLEDRRRGAAGAVVVLLGVGRRDADGKAARRVVQTTPSPRVVRILRFGGRCDGVRRARARRVPIDVEHRLADVRDELDAEQMLGRRVRVEQPALGVTVTTPLRMLRRMSSAWRRVCSSAATRMVLPFTALAQPRAQVADAERDERDDGRAAATRRARSAAS